MNKIIDRHDAYNSIYVNNLNTSVEYIGIKILMRNLRDAIYFKCRDYIF